MNKAELDFELPEELIARQPCERREASRLLVHHSAANRSQHAQFAELPDFLQAGDLLVLNDTRVVPARLALRKESGGRVEGLWLAHETDPSLARLWLSGGRLREGVRMVDERGEACVELVRKLAPGRWQARALRGAWPELLRAIGTPPLPPYIRRLRLAAGEDEIQEADHERYQTVWAEHAGSIAAPTASLHFTPQLLAQLEAKGVQRAHLTLHVGIGTFAPIDADDVSQHTMHAEEFSVSAACADALNAARADGRQVIAVGTTVARVLESLPRKAAETRGWTELFVLPGHRLRWLDGLITNFHTPQSTLLALVAAVCQAQGGAGLKQVRAVYAEAIAARYRFYSYGDSSFWLP